MLLMITTSLKKKKKVGALHAYFASSADRFTNFSTAICECLMVIALFLSCWNSHISIVEGDDTVFKREGGLTYQTSLLDKMVQNPLVVAL